MNKLFLIGRLIRDIDESKDVHYTSGDNATCITKFSIAVDKRFKSRNSDAPTADFFNITTFGKTAEFAKNYLKKGTKVVVEGRIENNNYTDSNGNKVYRDQIIAESIEFAESKKAAENNTEPVTHDENGFINMEELKDDLPF